MLRLRARVLLREVKKEQRKTGFDLICVFQKNGGVSVDSRVPNKLLNVALGEEDIAELTGCSAIVPEYNYGRERFDFFLQDHQPCLVEVKSCTLVDSGRALFPDAVTVMGKKACGNACRRENGRLSSLYPFHSSEKRRYHLFLKR